MGSVTVAKILVLVLTFGFSLSEIFRSRRVPRAPQRRKAVKG